MKIRSNGTCRSSVLEWRRRKSEPRSARRSCPSCCCSCTSPPPARWWSPCWVHSTCQSQTESVVWPVTQAHVVIISTLTRTTGSTWISGTHTYLFIRPFRLRLRRSSSALRLLSAASRRWGGTYLPVWINTADIRAWTAITHRRVTLRGYFIPLGKQSFTTKLIRFYLKKYKLGIKVTRCTLWSMLWHCVISFRRKKSGMHCFLSDRVHVLVVIIYGNISPGLWRLEQREINQLCK